MRDSQALNLVVISGWLFCWATGGHMLTVGKQAQEALQATDTEDDEDEDYDPYEERAETWQLKI